MRACESETERRDGTRPSVEPFERMGEGLDGNSTSSEDSEEDRSFSKEGRVDWTAKPIASSGAAGGGDGEAIVGE